MVNQALIALHGGSLEITITAAFKGIIHREPSMISISSLHSIIYFFIIHSTTRSAAEFSAFKIALKGTVDKI